MDRTQVLRHSPAVGPRRHADISVPPGRSAPAPRTGQASRTARALGNAGVERAVRQALTGGEGLRLHLDEQLQQDLALADHPELWSLLRRLPRDPTLPPTLRGLLPGLWPPGGGPETGVQIVFGPLTPEDALQALTQVPRRPDWLERSLRSATPEHVAAAEHPIDLYLVFSNDMPGLGSGSDQGPTADLSVFATSEGGIGLRRLRRVGLTLIGMATPRPTRRPGDPRSATSTFTTKEPGPFSGVVSLDVGITVARSGTWAVDFILVGGVDSPAWGKSTQGLVHRLTNDRLFPWPADPTRPLLEVGFTWRSFHELPMGEFLGGALTGRIELDLTALMGTRGTSGTARARFVLRFARMHTPVGDVSVEVSAGGLARGFLRANDGRRAPLLGVEGGPIGGVMVNIGRIGIGLLGEAISSTDPAMQTPVPAGTYPPALAFTPAVGSVETKRGRVSFGPAAGHHGVGRVVVKVSF